MAVADRAGFRAALAIFSIAAATIAGAWIIEALGYAPCELCLAQRWPYYFGIPLAGLTLIFALRGPVQVARFGFLLLALIFAASAIFGAYHAGIEWGFWPGPKDCSGPLGAPVSVADFLKQLETVKVVRCDAPALRILGLSLAAWNAVISTVLAGIAACRLARTRI